MSRIFVYTPRSGSRLIGYRGGSPDIRFETLSNGSHIVEGSDLMVVSFDAAQPGPRYCRDAARRIAADLITAGWCPAAWDDRGEISLVVRKMDAAQVAGLLMELFPFHKEQIRRSAYLGGAPGARIAPRSEGALQVYYG